MFSGDRQTLLEMAALLAGVYAIILEVCTGKAKHRK